MAAVGTPINSGATATATAVRVTPPTPPAPPTPPTPPAPPEPPAPAPPVDPAPSPAATVVELTNQRRAAAGRARLVVDPALTSAAQQHSADQANRGSMGHVGSNGSNVGQRIQANGGSFRVAGENVAFGYRTPQSVVVGWMNSPGHQRNMLNPSFTRIGVAVVRSADGTPYWTMVLAG